LGDPVDTSADADAAWRDVAEAIVLHALGAGVAGLGRLWRARLFEPHTPARRLPRRLDLGAYASLALGDWVGEGLALWLHDGQPRIAYQDAARADVVIATKDGAWSHDDATGGTGGALDGFHLAAPLQGAGPLVWDRITPARSDPHALVVLEVP